jgi:hypothetical protein
VLDLVQDLRDKQLFDCQGHPFATIDGVVLDVPAGRPRG